MANIVERVGELLKQLSPLDQRTEALVSQLTLKEKVALLSGLDIWRTAPIERAGMACSSSMRRRAASPGCTIDPIGGIWAKKPMPR